ncbi:putative mitochondrial hypothetical protein [Leptomonas pyrrhocoris]|uniref:Uncharacterized protein n=1 Tax=Leptomonas pyrrhocoris TaxID=157538 RepID=A0A0N1J4M6_LEPPY|nr:putative mitochondrial hypothetical protein [Leptomonas pyrrhocoris]XP_015656667.1 putative mitochondrial hypothetical protein [Leptomonas pyrrhocoris]KPA78227.1 putative mitochondrial hypothetical protein [Leptomonas pyrrhocoris]KPA78228.1 putative mitochondrial hypothetical protein [Leptomonas pyrrhocoris]|eukprot:XP_015656666.1 putative mitochondrial hypothetical protein [Leptomonas pyrrhocoris]
MLRYSLRRAVAAITGGFSSAAFTGDDGDAFNSLKSEQERLQRQHQSGQDAEEATARDNFSSDRSRSSGDESQNASTASSSSSSFTGFDFSSAAHANDGADASTSTLERPTIDTYRAMTDERLVDTLRLRDEQIAQLRLIYESFHYDADKHLRKMIFDYHDKTMQLSQVHGKMQQASLQINREALARMRDEQERMTRDKRLIFTLCTLWSIIFWVWVRRHYVKRRELESAWVSVVDRAQMSPAVTGIGSYGDNFFGSNKRNARFAETSWEREVRERREAQDVRNRQLALLRHQGEVAKAVAARDAGGAAVDTPTKQTP